MEVTRRRAGAVNENIIPRNGKEKKLPGKFSHLLVHPGETVTFLTAAAGGYGDRSERDSQAVKRDVELGYLSRERAGKDYLLSISAANPKP